MDMWHKITTFVDHYRWTVLAVVIAVVGCGLLMAAGGCESRTLGLEGDGKVTRTELSRQAIEQRTGLEGRRARLDAEIIAFNVEAAAVESKVEMASADLDRQDAVKTELLQSLSGLAVTAANGTFNPASLIPIGLGLFGGAMGLGASADNRRKDKVIDNVIDKSKAT